jgi:GTP-binding protein HflX
LHLAWISREIARQVGVLINRRGQVEQAFVGDAKRIYLPDLGRDRAGGRHLRGLRHVHTVLDASGLHTEDLADLEKLRLDAVCAINVTPSGEPGSVSYAYLLPNDRGERGHCTETSHSVHSMTFDFAALIAALEEERARQQVLRHVNGSRVRAVVLGLYPDRDTAQWRLNEIRELAATAGVVVEDTMMQIRRQIDGRFVVGRGKLEEAVLRCLDADAQLLIIDHDLTPAQARAIAAFSDLKVIDRTQLILDIFAQHARSRDGKLQVELAQLRYTLPRLTDMDAGLSRLTGGIGGRGPGETKLEINRRRARERTSRLEHEIEQLSKRRAVRREQRHRGAVPIISIVGYTNAGKSTLLNALTRSDVLVADQLFATLDPASRRLRFPREREAVVTDTVGFIQNLPVDLMQAFRATLEELESADLLLHVIDVSDPRRDEKAQVVRGVLSELGLSGIPIITVYNKADKVPQYEAVAVARKVDGVAISALTGQGLAPLVNRIAHRLWQTEALPEDNPWALEARLAVFGAQRELRPAVAG